VGDRLEGSRAPDGGKAAGLGRDRSVMTPTKAPKPRIMMVNNGIPPKELYHPSRISDRW
jgi:hypothetical protein